jgi:hypothetical protein
MFFAWIIMLPYYLFRTRRWRGPLVAAAVLALAVTPAIISVFVRISR